METGTVKFFNESKGFGFITSESGTDVFVHSTALGGKTIRENDRVTFNVEEGKKGLNATNITLL